MTQLPPLVISLACATLVGCVPTETGAWREEVEFSDGRVVVVDRAATWQESQPWGQNKSYSVREMTVSLPSDADKAPLAPWRGRRERALLLDFDTERQEYVLVTLPSTCERYIEAGRPRPPYLQYVLRDGDWSTIPLDTKLIGRHANLIVYPRVAAEPALITAGAKAERQKDPIGPAGTILATGGGFGECWGE